jgi:hypothetical protein
LSGLTTIDYETLFGSFLSVDSGRPGGVALQSAGPGGVMTPSFWINSIESYPPSFSPSTLLSEPWAFHATISGGDLGNHLNRATDTDHAKMSGQGTEVNEKMLDWWAIGGGLAVHCPEPTTTTATDSPPIMTGSGLLQRLPPCWSPPSWYQPSPGIEGNAQPMNVPSEHFKDLVSSEQQAIVDDRALAEHHPLNFDHPSWMLQWLAMNQQSSLETTSAHPNQLPTELVEQQQQQCTTNILPTIVPPDQASFVSWMLSPHPPSPIGHPPPARPAQSKTKRSSDNHHPLSIQPSTNDSQEGDSVLLERQTPQSLLKKKKHWMHPEKTAEPKINETNSKTNSSDNNNHNSSSGGSTGNLCCANCKTRTAPTWRRSPIDNRLVCNACGLYAVCFCIETRKCQ